MGCRNRLVWTWVVVMLATTGVAAQGRPDFSGRWTLSTGGPDAGLRHTEIPVALTVSQTLVRTTLRGEPMDPYFGDIIIERHFEAASRSETYRIGTQGGVVPAPRPDGTPNDPTVFHAVRWDGNTLVVERSSRSGPGRDPGTWAERREAWSLEPDGRLRVVITTRGSDEGSRAVTLLYQRA